ncbi:MAG: glycosyltransferase [Pseudomonadota bacterium]
MNALLNPQLDQANDNFASSNSHLDIRHLVFDMCASHDLKANGVYNVARQLAAEQRAVDEDAGIVFLREQNREMPNEGDDIPMQVLVISGRKILGRRVSLDDAILSAMTAPSDKPVFFHIHAARQPLLMPVVLRLRKLGLPYAMTIHGRYAHVFDQNNEIKRRLPAIYLQTVERYILEGARFVQGVSEAECALIKKIAPKARVELVRNAAYSSHFEGEPKRPSRAVSEREHPKFGYLGRYELEHKGLDLLVDGFAAYRSAGGQGTLELVGTGPAREEIISLAQEYGISDHVTADGPRFGDEKAKTLADWDYFVMPSRFEGVPIGALEAGLAGLPLIVSSETGLQDYVRMHDAGVGIEELTGKAIGEALLEAESRFPADWSMMSDSAYDMALAIGDWTKISESLVKLYKVA